MCPAPGEAHATDSDKLNFSPRHSVPFSHLHGGGNNSLPQSFPPLRSLARAVGSNYTRAQLSIPPVGAFRTFPRFPALSSAAYSSPACVEEAARGRIVLVRHPPSKRTGRDRCWTPCHPLGRARGGCTPPRSSFFLLLRPSSAEGDTAAAAYRVTYTRSLSVSVSGPLCCCCARSKTNAHIRNYSPD